MSLHTLLQSRILDHQVQLIAALNLSYWINSIIKIVELLKKITVKAHRISIPIRTKNIYVSGTECVSK